MFASRYAEYYDLLNKEKPYKKEIEFVYEWAGKPKSIFDIGCGTGSYWDFYPPKTLLFGVDKSREMARRPGIICADITKYNHQGRFYCATALFDVLNYIPKHGWWKNIPIDKGGHFIFDIWDTKKIETEGFKETLKITNGITRRITPFYRAEKSINLMISVNDGERSFSEIHKMFFHSHEDIIKFCGEYFEIVEVKPTETWQIWYKCIRR